MKGAPKLVRLQTAIMIEGLAEARESSSDRTLSHTFPSLSELRINFHIRPL
jgi:hypothetical protein